MKKRILRMYIKIFSDNNIIDVYKSIKQILDNRNVSILNAHLEVEISNFSYISNKLQVLISNFTIRLP